MAKETTMRLKKYELLKTSCVDLLNDLLKGRTVRLLPHSGLRKVIHEGVIKSVDYGYEVYHGAWFEFTFEDGATHPVSHYQDFEVLPQA